MLRFIHLITLFTFCYYYVHCVQPYFPSQVVFTVDNGQRLYAIDQVNQRAFVSIKDNPAQNGYVFQHFPYSPADTPQSRHYVRLITTDNPKTCAYETYWKYGRNSSNYFPEHWNNQTTFQIGNYLNLNYTMIYNFNQSDLEEDYWYSAETCYDAVHDVHPCFRLYFKHANDTPLRSIQLQSVGERSFFQTTEYQIISIGKPDDKYFAGIPTNWYTSCLDTDLQLEFFADSYVIYYRTHRTVAVSLFAPPHRVNGNDSVTITWNLTGCDNDCLTWAPQQLTFNSQNFNRIQNLTFLRIDDSDRTFIRPTFIGGGFDLVSPDLNEITFESG